MPLIKLKHISSFSSEDTAQPSSNLLKPETYRKWRCAEPGEKQAVVVIELEKSTKIHSIDVGNNGSAFVEVLVGRSSGADEKYKVLLVASSFMTPADSKSFTNTNRVRMFGNEKLSKPVSDEKWDKVKLVCTQPFNKNERYGLSFVSFHSPPEDSPSKKEEEIQTKKRLGSFTLRDEEKDNIKPGSLFFKKKTNSPPPTSSTAALVRDASSLSSPSSVHSLKNSDSGLLKSRQPVASKPREQQERKHVIQELKPAKHVKPFLSTPPEATSNKRKVEITHTKSHLSKPVSPPPKKAKRTENVPFHQIMKGVVFVLSGFKNPERGEIRDKALEMGAQYKPDWMTGCTHLICAFANTPKYFQVKGKGKIITKKWISDCHRKKTKLATKNYHLPGDTSSSDDSSTDDDEPQSTQSFSRKSPVDNSRNNMTEHSGQDEKTPNDEEIPKVNRTPEPPSIQNDEKGAYDEDTDDDIPTPIDTKGEDDNADSGQDTEDELERLQDKENNSDVNDDDIYNMSTEDEDEENDKDDQVQNGDSSGPDELPELPDFFSKKHFLLYGEMDQLTRRTLIRYITAYNGILEDYMTESIDFVITNETWDQNFEDALSENASLAFIKPKWIFDCHDNSTMVPFQPYIITPS